MVVPPKFGLAKGSSWVCAAAGVAMAATAMAATVPQRNFFIIFFPLSCRPGACAGLRPNTCTVLVGAPGGHRCLPFRLVSARGQAAGESSDRRTGDRDRLRLIPGQQPGLARSETRS